MEYDIYCKKESKGIDVEATYDDTSNTAVIKKGSTWADDKFKTDNTAPYTLEKRKELMDQRAVVNGMFQSDIKIDPISTKGTILTRIYNIIACTHDGGPKNWIERKSGKTMKEILDDLVGHQQQEGDKETPIKDNDTPKDDGNDQDNWEALKDKNGRNYPHNRIIFGAPGTGKSHKLEKETENIKDVVTRVTFHPDYSYAHFVGCYKPYMEGKDIRYEFIAGPFLEVYKKAKKDPDNHYVLIIEEINRANVAAVFGDVFQLLDRKENGESEYPIATSKDIKDWLTEKNKETKTENAFELPEAEKLSIPKNMYIWATMNSADQGVYPMDTAFKRRWTFEYMDIDAGKDSIKDWKITLPNGQTCKWNNLREAINEKLIAERVNEDKCLGPHFIKEEDGKDKGKFASKVLMYLFEDVVKQNPSKIFNLEKNELIFSKVCKKFSEKGLEVFNLNKKIETDGNKQTNSVEESKESDRTFEAAVTEDQGENQQ